jgi:hypothetical protein
MAKPRAKNTDAAFARGEVGVDGQEIEEERDEAEVEQEKAKESLVRGRTYLGREFLTWLLWQSEAGAPILKHDGDPLSVLFTGRVAMRGVGGDVTEVTAKGNLAPYSALVRQVLDRGLLLHQARLQLTHGERTFEATLDAEHFDVRSGKIPDLLTEADDDRMGERLDLAEHLGALIEALLEHFVALRSRPTWNKEVAPALKAWMHPTTEARPSPLASNSAPRPKKR